MNCDCKCDVLTIRINTVNTSATENALTTLETIPTVIPNGMKVVIVVDVTELPVNNLPVVVTDGTTTIPLRKLNGNDMREGTFLPYCKRIARCSIDAKVHCRNFNDPEHLNVLPSRSY